jgi:hypothetical protein
MGIWFRVMKTLTVKIPEALYAKILAEAEVRRVSRSEVVRERLEAGEIPPGMPGTGTLTLWNRLSDLVVDDDSLPSDLSSRHVHMDGYGADGPR